MSNNCESTKIAKEKLNFYFDQLVKKNFQCQAPNLYQHIPGGGRDYVDAPNTVESGTNTNIQESNKDTLDLQHLVGWICEIQGKNIPKSLLNFFQASSNAQSPSNEASSLQIETSFSPEHDEPDNGNNTVSSNSDIITILEEYVNGRSPKKQITKDEFERLFQDVLLDSVASRDFETLVHAESYNCWPPKLFIPIICIVQVFIRIYHYQTSDVQNIGTMCSRIAYNPDRRWEVWRLFTYSLTHANEYHLGMNILGQLIIGIPIEMSNSSLRVAIVYFCGVVAGALGSVVMTKDEETLTGASGGVYALLGAHIASLLLNWKKNVLLFRPRITVGKPAKAIQAKVIRLLRVGVIVMFILINVSQWMYEKLIKNCYEHSGKLLCRTVTNYSAHLFGALAGLLVGYVVLKERGSESVLFRCLDSKNREGSIEELCQSRTSFSSRRILRAHRSKLLKTIVIFVIVLLYLGATLVLINKQYHINGSSINCSTNEYYLACHDFCMQQENNETTSHCNISICPK